jgi:branched-chain amino acid aminotransferase
MVKDIPAAGAAGSAAARSAPPVPAQPAYLWHNGRLVPWDDATVHLTDIGWTAISAVFEGARAYASADGSGLALFRLDQHLKRLAQSMKLMRMTLPWSLDEVRDGMIELLRANAYDQDVYLQPLAYFGGRVPGYEAAYTQPGEIYITARPAPSKLGTAPGSNVCVSSWTRIADNVMPPRAKALANYQNSRLVSTEARINGYDTGIVLNDRGKVSEGAWSCVFVVRDGVAITPSVTSDILEGITRASLIDLLRDELGIRTEEREVDRTELYIADEVFLCGTLIEIDPVLSVDRYTIGDGAPGPVTQAVAQLFEQVARGGVPRYQPWLERVAIPQAAAAGAAEEGHR